MDTALWNVLHDGRIMAIEGELPGDLTLSIEIAYLCRRLRTASDCVVLALRGCLRFEYRPYDSDASIAENPTTTIGLEILSASYGLGGLVIECADEGSGGQLHANYQTASVFSVEGELQSQEMLEQASDEYWTDWSNKKPHD